MKGDWLSNSRKINDWLMARRLLWTGKNIKSKRYLKVAEIEPLIRQLIDEARADRIYSTGTGLIDIAFAISKRIESLDRIIS